MVPGLNAAWQIVVAVCSVAVVEVAFVVVGTVADWEGLRRREEGEEVGEEGKGGREGQGWGG